MIIAERKPMGEIKGFLDKHERVLVLGCGTCVAVCLAGGEKQVAELSSVLRLANGAKTISEATIERQCDAEFFPEVEELISSCDAVLSMACGVGVQMVAQLFPDKPAYPAVNTIFIGSNDGAGQWSEKCLACGDCRVAQYGGICPIARCSKSLVNGPCGGSMLGMCERDPENIECGWQKIYDRLKALGQLEILYENSAPVDWSTTFHGGRRQLSREDMAEL
jgi:ferredoxin